MSEEHSPPGWCRSRAPWYPANNFVNRIAIAMHEYIKDLEAISWRRNFLLPIPIGARCSARAKEFQDCYLLGCLFCNAFATVIKREESASLSGFIVAGGRARARLSPRRDQRRRLVPSLMTLTLTGDWLLLEEFSVDNARAIVRTRDSVPRAYENMYTNVRPDERDCGIYQVYINPWFYIPFRRIRRSTLNPTRT